MAVDDARKIALQDSDIPDTVITVSEWRALLAEDPQADPEWPAGWLERLRLECATAEPDTRERSILVGSMSRDS